MNTLYAKRYRILLYALAVMFFIGAVLSAASDRITGWILAGVLFIGLLWLWVAENRKSTWMVIAAAGVSLVLLPCGAIDRAQDGYNNARTWFLSADEESVDDRGQEVPRGITDPISGGNASYNDANVNVSSASCPQARDLGPWAPTASGEGSTFEVTASDQGGSNLSSGGVVLGLWWPAGSGQSWGIKEITTFIPRGLSITVVAGAGRGWDYEATCNAQEIQNQMELHMAARGYDTNYHGFIPFSDLVTAGLVSVRHDRRGNANTVVPSASTALPTPSLPQQQFAPANTPGTGGGGNTSSGYCTATRMSTDLTFADEINAGSGTVISIDSWGHPQGYNGFILVPSGYHYRGAQGGMWSYNCDDLTAVLADVHKHGVAVYVLQSDGTLVQQ